MVLAISNASIHSGEMVVKTFEVIFLAEQQERRDTGIPTTTFRRVGVRWRSGWRRLES
jgi:hypothetical protein